jgi:DNA-binding FrmR family transcriptional regulator
VGSDDREAIDRRLARIEGQVRGLRRLLREDAYCCDLLTQISAVNSAVHQVAGAVAAMHLKHCLLSADGSERHPHARTMSRDELAREFEEVLKRLMKS